MLPEGCRDGVEHLARLFENPCKSNVSFPADEILTGTARQRKCRFTQDDIRCVNMAFLPIYKDVNSDYPTGALARDPGHPRILIFTEGTVLGPRHWWEFFNDKGYVPVGRCVEKICGWEAQGAKIAYLTSRRNPTDVAAIRGILQRYEFPGSCL